MIDLSSGDDEVNCTPVKATNIDSLSLVTPDGSAKKKKVKRKCTPVRPKGDFPLRQNQYKLALNFEVASAKAATSSEKKSQDSSDLQVAKIDKFKEPVCEVSASSNEEKSQDSSEQVDTNVKLQEAKVMLERITDSDARVPVQQTLEKEVSSQEVPQPDDKMSVKEEKSLDSSSRDSSQDPEKASGETLDASDLFSSSSPAKEVRVNKTSCKLQLTESDVKYMLEDSD